ncbi:MAG: Sensor histidine kinase RcsC [Anaerolineae bacterium]|nr:Sensor histidine kinase RcsC [Anaerolineae bacterium]
MSAEETEFFEKLLATFNIEANESLKSITAGLLELENAADPDTQTRWVERVFREAHSLKGAARAVNKLDVETVCQSIESVFSALKQRSLTLSPALFDTLHHALDAVETLLTQPHGESSALAPQVMQQIERLLAGKSAPAPPPTAPPLPPPEPVLPPPAEPDPATEKSASPLPATRPLLGETVRISTAKLDNLLLQAEEFLSVKLSTNQHVADLREIVGMLDVWQREWSKAAPEVQRVQRQTEQNGAQRRRGDSQPSLARLLDFLNWNRAHMEVLTDRLQTLTKSVEQEEHSVGGMIDNLLEDVKKSLMLPFSALLDTFPKMVRDLSRAQGKNVALSIKGGEVELDRRILEEVKAPLIHILRNCIDHGIETPDIRRKANKPEQGQIIVTVSQLDAGKVEIIISDDGAGINLEKLKAAALQQGCITVSEAAAMNPQETMHLIFRSAVSTSAIITDMSGRGLGMAIVREKIEQLGGKINVASAQQLGTSFQILLPVAVATFRGVLVQANQSTFIIPTSSVERVLRINKVDIATVQNRPTIEIDGRIVPLTPLAEVLELPRPPADDDRSSPEQPYLQVLLMGTIDRRRAFVVDRIINEQEVLVKNLGKKLTRVRNVSGATVLGSGQVVPILRVSDLLKSAERLLAGNGRPTQTVKKAGNIQKSILIAEDSITSRTLLKNILESAGYRVRATVDGVDALTALKTEPFDLLISDVEMPRMNGFELTGKIRADNKFSGLPVVLVTSLGSPEDRERGIDAGADAYITKSSFDQTNLLAIIKRLV